MKHITETLEAFITKHGLDIEILGNSIWKYIISHILIIIYFLLFAYIQSFLIKKIKTYESHSKLNIILNPISIALKKTSKIFLFALAVRLSLLNLHITPTIDKGISLFISVVTFVQLGLWLDTISQLITDAWINKSDNLSPLSTVANLVKFSIRLCVWILLTLIFLDNLGVNVTTLVTGLGIGGIAVALAVQNILGDLLCSLSIALDEPFQVGDSIVLGTVNGKVEKIGIKSTRIRSLSGELIVVPNSDLIKGQIQNFKRMEERRIIFSIGVIYETPSEKLKQIPEMVKKIIESQKSTRFDRCHLLKLSDSALVFETVYYILSSEYIAYANAQQEINLEIISQFKEQGIEFAYPTTMQYTKNMILENSTSAN